VGKGEVISRLLYRHPETKKTLYREEDLPFYKKQHRIVFGQNGMLDPSRIEAYFNINGYQALAKVLSEMTPEAVISEVKKAGPQRPRRRRISDGHQMGRRPQGAR